MNTNSIHRNSCIVVMSLLGFLVILTGLILPVTFTFGADVGVFVRCPGASIRVVKANEDLGVRDRRSDFQVSVSVSFSACKGVAKECRVVCQAVGATEGVGICRL